ncbi:MAG: internal scaffolding protein [Microviridae sp.]|nr:MAG: internal scaffolding protein [Microviridae sp.]
MSYQPNNPRPSLTENSIIKTLYSPKQRYSLTFPEDSPHTKQEFKDECDINILMSLYQKTGQLPNINERAPQYLDVTGIDYQSAMEFVAGANTLFHELPSAIRTRFENDPAQFLDFCSHEKNRPEMQEMGLLKPIQDQVIPYPDSGDKVPQMAAPLRSASNPDQQQNTSQSST